MFEWKSDLVLFEYPIQGSSQFQAITLLGKIPPKKGK